MKTLVTIISLALASMTIGQNYSVNQLVDRDSTLLTAVFSNPSDTSQLIAVELSYDWLNQNNKVDLFLVDQTGLYVPIVVPFCGQIHTLPVVFNNKLYFAAETFNYGEELIEYDGLNATIIDVEIGIQGSSPSNMKVENDFLYFTARKNGELQVFGFDNLNGVEQLTQESNNLSMYFVSKIDNNTIYGMSPSASITCLKKVDENGNSMILRLFDYSLNNLMGSWFNALKVGTNILIAETVGEINQADLRIIATLDYQIFDTLVEETMVTNTSPAELQQINGLIYAKLRNHYYSTIDGQLFSQFYPSFPHTIRDLFYFENAIYGIAVVAGGEPQMIYKFESGVATELYSNRHLHLMVQDGHDAYFSSWNSDPLIESSVVRLAYDQIDEIPVSLIGLHSPTKNSSLILNDKLTFLYANGVVNESVDIYQIDGLAKLNSSEIGGFSIYPNPSHSSSQVVIKSPSSSKLDFIDAVGNHVHALELNTGLNYVDLPILSPGTYFLKMDTYVLKHIIE